MPVTAQGKTVKVIPGYEGKRFMWTGDALGLAGNRKDFEKLKSGESVMLPYQIADQLILNPYFIEIKTKAAKTEKKGDE